MPLTLVHSHAPEPVGDATASASAAPAEAMPLFETIDRTLHARIAQATSGLDPVAQANAFADWALHLALSPGKQLDLAQRAVSGAWQNLAMAVHCSLGGTHDPCDCALPQDDRFRDAAWKTAPFNIYAHTFLSVERWWEAATTGVRGVSDHHARMATFATRQMLDTLAPSNFIATNPQVLERTRAERGQNLLRGLANWAEDARRERSRERPAGSEAFRVGETVATSPGQVVHQTRLAEIIQYAPTTERVRPEPIVIVPAWILKYYILDLSPVNSLVRYLTGQGFTVFMVSWKNPGSEDRDIGFDDYRTLGVLPAVAAATAITGSSKVHAVGYCLGGTLLAIAAAAMARAGDERLASLSFLAAQTDFTDAGELKLFINESQLAFLEDMMWERGYLDAKQMAGAFQLMRSKDLIWSRIIRDYLMGERSSPIDIMVWSTDTTRMPYRMHSEYLRSLFLNDDLAEGRFEVEGHPIALSDIRLPVFAVGTEQDHIAPWRSVFKSHLRFDADVTFVLTSGGHNAGILSEPGHAGRRHRIATKREHDRYVGPDRWLADNPPQNGSWWPAWAAWLTERSGALAAPPPFGRVGTPYQPLRAAPGEYVLMK